MNSDSTTALPRPWGRTNSPLTREEQADLLPAKESSSLREINMKLRENRSSGGGGPRRRPPRQQFMHGKPVDRPRDEDDRPPRRFERPRPSAQAAPRPGMTSVGAPRPDPAPKPIPPPPVAPPSHPVHPDRTSIMIEVSKTLLERFDAVVEAKGMNRYEVLRGLMDTYVENQFRRGDLVI